MECGPCYIVRRGKATALQNLTSKAFGAALLLLAAASASAQNVPVMVGQTYDGAVASLKAKGIAYQESASGTGRVISYGDQSEGVTLDFTPWPKDPAAPAAAWSAGSSAEKHLVLTHILDVAASSDARRTWVRTFEKDGQRWAYLPEKANARRTPAERSKYPVEAYLQWPARVGAAPVTFLFQAARAPGTPPASEATALEIFLDNPHTPRQF